MRFLKIFAAVVLVCFSFALNGFGQKVEIKQDSVFNSKNGLGQKVSVKRYKIDVDSKLYLYVEKQYNPYHQDYNRKHKTDFGFIEIKNPANHLLAYITNYANGNKIIDNKFELTFNTDNGENLTYEIANSRLIQKIAHDFLINNVVKDGFISRPGLKLLFQKYYLDVTKSFQQRWICGTGLSGPTYEIDLNENQLQGNELDCKFSISAMLNDSTIKSIKYYNSENGFIGEAIIDSIGKTEYGCRNLNYQFISKEKEEKFITVCDNEYYSIYANRHTPDSVKIWTDDNRFFKYDSNFIGFEFNTRVIDQIIHLGEALKYLYFL